MIWLLSIFVLLVVGCSQPANRHAVTVAFPIAQNSNIEAIQEFHAALLRDGKHYLDSSRLEGMPIPIVQIAMDSAKLEAFSHAEIVSKLDIFQKLPKALRWECNPDSLLFAAEIDPLESKSDISQLGDIIISAKDAQNPVRLKDLAQIQSLQKSAPVTIHDQACIAIIGTSAKTSEEIVAWLSGMDVRLGLQYFLVVKD